MQGLGCATLSVAASLDLRIAIAPFASNDLIFTSNQFSHRKNLDGRAKVKMSIRFE